MYALTFFPENSSLTLNCSTGVFNFARLLCFAFNCYVRGSLSLMRFDVCLQRDPKQCCEATKLVCTHCTCCRLLQWVQSNFVASQHCFVSFFETRKSCQTMLWWINAKSIHTEDESKCGIAFAFIFGLNWPVQWVQSSIVASHHCLGTSRRRANIKISWGLGVS